MTNSGYDTITGPSGVQHFAWFGDSLDYETQGNTNYAFNQENDESNNSRISPTDFRANTLPEIVRELDYEGKPVGIDPYGKFVGYDGIEFTEFDSTEYFDISGRTERNWGVSDPVEHHVREQAKGHGPWIVTQESYQEKVLRDGRDLSNLTIVDQHAASRWSDRGDKLNYENILKELQEATVYEVPDEVHSDWSFDFLRQGKHRGTIFPQKGNRITTTLPNLDRQPTGQAKHSIREILSKD
jgi:hypothetical protein